MRFYGKFGRGVGGWFAVRACANFPVCFREFPGKLAFQIL